MNKTFYLLLLINVLITNRCAVAQFCHPTRVSHVSHNNVIIKKEKEIVKEYVPTAVVSPYAAFAVPIYSYISAPGYIPGAPYVPGPTPGSVMQQPQANNDAERIADLVIQKLENRLKSNQGAVPGSNQGGGNQGGNDGPPAIKPTSRADKENAKNRAVALLQTKCASCHSSSESGGGLVFFDNTKNLLAMPAERRIAIYDAVYEGRMPKEQPLSDQEVELIRIWMKQK